MAQRSWARGEPLVMLELPTPEPRPDEVRIAVKAIGVNPVDWKMRTLGPLRLAARIIGPPPPVVVGVDFAGVVDALGSQVTGLSPGMRVVGGTDFSRKQRGSYADTVVVRPDQLCPLPPEIDFETAGALPVAGVTAWMSLVEIGRLVEGQRALVLGASGGVGQLAVQFAKRVLGGFVAGVCSGKNTTLVKELGADVVLDYTQGDPLAQARAHGPFQVVMDCVGGYSGSGCRALLAPGGRHVVVSGDTPAAMLQLLVPPFSSKPVLARANRERLGHVVRAVAAGKVKVNIAQRFALADAEKAHALSQTGRVTGKLVLLP
ncbi:MAG TPA: NAD(P)-dependent alcohol dehydrogenase [Myxococcota bacterium]|nr:NAD(P)-dependent alcohol dehydrogenase [Myxococcota bacterium]